MSGGLHPYRQSSRPIEEGASRIDLEHWVVHGILGAIGAIGVVVGFAAARPTELAVGGLLFVAASRVIGRELWRNMTHRRCR